MKTQFGVMYDFKGRRDSDEFKTKLQAFKFALSMADKGATKIFIDEFNQENDTVNYYKLSKNSDQN